MTYSNFSSRAAAEAFLTALQADGWRGYVSTFNDTEHQVRVW